MQLCKNILLFICVFRSFEVAATPSFYGKSLPELLQYTGSRCAYEVVVEKAEVEKPGMYTGVVVATQTARFGEVAELNPKLTAFNVVATNNLRKDSIANDEGDDYYSNSLSLSNLKVGEKYLFLCRGSEIFEVLANSPENAYKIKLFMMFNWEKSYFAKTSLSQLQIDLADADLSMLAYSVLQRKGALNDQLITEAVRNQADNRLLYLHLAKLSGERVGGEIIDVPAIRTAAQMEFLSLLLSQLKESEVQQPLFEAFTKIVQSDELLIDLNQTKIGILLSYLNLFKGAYRNQMAYHNRLLEKVVTVTAVVPSINAQFLEPVLLYAASAPSLRKTVTNYVNGLESLERIRFLNRMLALFEPIVRARYQTQSHRQIAEFLAEQLPLYPSGLYLRSLAAFNPYLLDPKIPNEAALKNVLASKLDSLQMRQQTLGISTGVNFVVRTLNAIVKNAPETKASVKLIGDRYTDASSVFATLVDVNAGNEYKRLMHAASPAKLPKVAAGSK